MLERAGTTAPDTQRRSPLIAPAPAKERLANVLALPGNTAGPATNALVATEAVHIIPTNDFLNILIRFLCH